MQLIKSRREMANNFKIREWLLLWLKFLFIFVPLRQNPDSIWFGNYLYFSKKKKRKGRRNLQPVFHIKIFIGNKILFFKYTLEALLYLNIIILDKIGNRKDFIRLKINLLLFYAIWFLCVFFFKFWKLFLSTTSIHVEFLCIFSQFSNEQFCTINDMNKS